MPRAGQPGLEAGPCRADFVVIRAALKRPAGRVGNPPGVGAVSLPGPEGPSRGLAWRGGRGFFQGWAGLSLGVEQLPRWLSRPSPHPPLAGPERKGVRHGASCMEGTVEAVSPEMGPSDNKGFN